MDAKATKQAFLNIYDRVLRKTLHKGKANRKTELEDRKLVAQLIMVAWNRCNDCKTLTEAKNDIVEYANLYFGGKEKIVSLLLNAVSIKWHDYGDDHTFIPGVSVGIVDGNPMVDPKLESELPRTPLNPVLFKKYLESPEIRERLSRVPVEKLDKEIDKITVEFNARLQQVPASINEDLVADDKYDGLNPELFKIPLSRSTLDHVHERTLWNIPLENKKKFMTKILNLQPFLAVLCKDCESCFTLTDQIRQMPGGKSNPNPGSIPELIQTMFAAYCSTVDFNLIPDHAITQCSKNAETIVVGIKEDTRWLYTSGVPLDEPALIEFIVEHTMKLVPDLDEQETTMKLLLAWGLAIGTVRQWIARRTK
jgi:hypothetical protein